MKHSSFLTEYRKQNNLTQAELANEIGINAAILSRLERNIGNPTTRLVLDWCQRKGIKPNKVYPPEAAA